MICNECARKKILLLYVKHDMHEHEMQFQRLKELTISRFQTHITVEPGQFGKMSEEDRVGTEDDIPHLKRQSPPFAS